VAVIRVTYQFENEALNIPSVPRFSVSVTGKSSNVTEMNEKEIQERRIIAEKRQAVHEERLTEERSQPTWTRMFLMQTMV
jgi:hypothetical protein